MTFFPLTVDGADVPRAHLVELTDRLTAELAGHGVGAGRAVMPATGDPVTTVATMLAADRLDAPVLLGGHAATDAEPAWAVVDATARVRAARDRPGGPLPERTAAVLWTSGTSGRPKAVALSRQALAYQGDATAAHLGISARDRLLLPLPLHHSYAYSVLQVCRSTGAHLYVESGFQVRRIIRRIRDARITSMDGVPSMYRALAADAGSHPETRAALAGLRIRGCGGDVLAPGLHERFVGRTGVGLHDGYGLTEAGPNVAINVPGRIRPGSVGSLLDGTRARVHGPDREVQVNSPSLMTGYVDPATGALLPAPFTEDGWLPTGDTGAVSPDGHLTITGRIKEVLIVHGETVAPAILEDVIRTVPGVAEAVVLGRPGRARGDEIHAFVQPADGAADRAALRARVLAACRGALPPQLRPRAVHLAAELPRTASGKVERRGLRALYADVLGAGS
ncbi:long-chain fatty acid--CoA ligase [Kitasatospora sp. NPDC096140]|uniref:class I adenylate-forming enzyme family protein n=1 Tax=Kitasatospora sp. NPDC096140 TaxID=3155425 RepID=UPI003331FE3C